MNRFDKTNTETELIDNLKFLISLRFKKKGKTNGFGNLTKRLLIKFIPM